MVSLREAAIADDASVIASNPAAMLLLKDCLSFAGGGSAILGHVEVAGRVPPPGAIGSVPAYASNVAKESGYALFLRRRKITDSLSVGLGTYTTYGLRINYPVSFSARTESRAELPGQPEEIRDDQSDQERQQGRLQGVEARLVPGASDLMISERA